MAVIEGDLGSSEIYGSGRHSIPKAHATEKLENLASEKQDIKPVTKIDSEYVDRVMDLDLPKKDLALALAKEYGKQGAMEEALKDWQGQNGYRQTDIADVVRNVLSKPEIIDAEFESIDAVVEYQPKPSMLKVAAKGTANLARKMHLHQWYYPLVGALPGKYQKEFAKRHGDDCLNYTLYNALLEGITIMGLVSYSTYFITHDILATSSWGSLGLMVGALYATARVGMAADNEVNDGIKAGGSPLTVIPYYLVLCSIAAVKAIKHAVTEPYSSARKELEQKSLEENKRIEVSNNRIEEPKIIGTEQQAEQEAAAEEEFTIKETNSTTIIS